MTYCYDGATLNPTTQTCAAGGASGSVLGQLTGVGNNLSTTNFTGFSNRGWVTASTQTTAGTAYNFSGYAYALNGTLKSITYSSGRQVTDTLDNAGRVDPGTADSDRLTPALTQFYQA